jgi:acetyl-CoA/propionyl-CoA carboxylase biotin carboxyl carrier protein
MAAIIAGMDDIPIRTPITTLLVANRGEIAVRVIRAAHDLGIRAAAVYGEGEQNALHVRLADDAWRIPSEAPIPYLDIPAILEVARRSGADAVHPGYGFLAENAAFARACDGAGLIFVGPPPEAIAAMGDKIEARRIAVAAGVPMVPGTDGPVASPTEALAWGEAHGYPVAVKAAGGGGGRGFRVARGPEEMEAAFLGASGEAARFFANPEVYLERYLEDPRHVEIQLMADAHGHVVAVGSRDCSIQRRHQKLIEEAPAPGIPDETRRALAEAAVALARAVDYRGAGTVEFLLDAEGTFAFLEMNTRVQVEHPVTEMTTGIDLVREQILVAGGEPLSFAADDVAPLGHAIECRINAEDPSRGFAPSPGAIARVHAPAGMGIRVDSAAEGGGSIHPAYDSLIAKVISWGRDRVEATARMIRALEELEIEGVSTTRDFHLRVLRHPAWSESTPATTFLDRHPEVLPSPAETTLPDAPRQIAATPVVAEVDGHRFEVRIHGLTAGVATESSIATRRPARPAAGSRRVANNGATLQSPIQGTVVRVAAAVGDRVERGQTICVVEAMKMENDVAAHRDGVLAAIAATPGMAVRVGDTLAEIA